MVERFCGRYNRRDAINGFPLIVIVDDSEFAARTLDNFLWTTSRGAIRPPTSMASSRSSRDKHWGCFGSLVIDARSKPHHAPPLVEDPAVSKRSTRWPPAAARCTGSSEKARVIAREGCAECVRRSGVYVVPFYFLADSKLCSICFRVTCRP